MQKLLYLCLAFALFMPSLVNMGSVNATAHDMSQLSPHVVEVIQPRELPGLPNVDVRLQHDEQRLTTRTAADREALRARLDSIEAFRANLQPQVQTKLRFELDQIGVPKTFFNYEAPLSVAQGGEADTTARTFLREHSGIFGLTVRDVRTLKLESRDEDQETTFLNYEQTINGVAVFHGHVRVAISSNGEVLRVNQGKVIPGERLPTEPVLAETEAVKKAFEYAGREGPANLAVLEPRASRGARAVYAHPNGPEFENILSDLRIMRIAGTGVLVWHLYIDFGSPEFYEMCIDATTGELLFRFNLFQSAAQGTVFRQHPAAGGRTLESFVGNTSINPDGWMGASQVTTGNNVDAYLDTDGSDVPDATNGTGLSNGRAFSSVQDFTFPFTIGVDPRIQQPAVLSNLFYFVNTIHDFTYNLGFTEAAGNFQANNFGRGGQQDDRVLAQAQDGTLANNAFFATPPDGTSPRMMLHIFTQGTSSLADDRDTALDGDVVIHEFGHGVSNRLVGGPANTNCLMGTQSGALGEGWSDYLAATFYSNGVIGEYVTNNFAQGIRRAAYTVPANAIHNSYADLGNQGFNFHRDGEVWAATLWDLQTTLGPALVDRLVIHGMKLTPCGPSFLNARDAIIQADQVLNGGANRCMLWQIFASHGMGASASGNDGTVHNAATNLPSDCQPPPPPGCDPDGSKQEQCFNMGGIHFDPNNCLCCTSIQITDCFIIE